MHSHSQGVFGTPVRALAGLTLFGRGLIGSEIALTLGTSGAINPNIQIYGVGTTSSLSLIRESTPGAGGALITLGSSRGEPSKGTFSALKAGDGVGTLVGVGDLGTTLHGQCAGISMAADEDWSSSTCAGRIIFGVTASGDSNFTEALRINSTRHIGAGVDNTQTLGTVSKRWAEVFAGTGTINTSDARDKTDVTPLTKAELVAATQIAREIGTFKFLSAVSAKGEEARLHTGLTVQRAVEIMKENSLDPLAYGFICHDSWGHEAAIVDEAGHTISQETKAGDRYGFRHEEMLLFIARGLEARMTALEAKL